MKKEKRELTLKELGRKVDIVRKINLTVAITCMVAEFIIALLVIIIQTVEITLLFVVMQFIYLLINFVLVTIYNNIVNKYNFKLDKIKTLNKLAVGRDHFKKNVMNREILKHIFNYEKRMKDNE